MRTTQAQSVRPRRRPLADLGAATLLAAAVAGCTEDPYQDSVTSPQDAHDPTDAEIITPPPAETSAPGREQREPLQVGEDEVIDAQPDQTAASPASAAGPERSDRAPLEHPSRAQRIDPAGEPVEAAVPDEPTRSMDPTEAPAVDPVATPLDEADGRD